MADVYMKDTETGNGADADNTPVIAIEIVAGHSTDAGEGEIHDYEPYLCATMQSKPGDRKRGIALVAEDEGPEELLFNTTVWSLDLKELLNAYVEYPYANNQVDEPLIVAAMLREYAAVLEGNVARRRVALMREEDKLRD